MTDPDTRILRRIPPLETWTYYAAPAGAVVKRANAIDSETTSTDPLTAKIIELAVLPFDYIEDGTIVAAHPPQSWLQDPGEPLSAEVMEVTGLTDEMLAGQKIDQDAVQALVGGGQLNIAHNAAYDRKICERHFPFCKELPWSCSVEEIDWRHHFQAPSRALQVAAWSMGYFFDAHRAAADCLALAYLLMQPGRDGRPLSSHLFERARAHSYRVYAVNSPFEKKDALKARGYHWDALRKVWHRDMLTAETRDAEVAWLQENARCAPEVEAMNAYVRYRE